MAQKCAHCGSLETQTQADAYQCLICGNVTTTGGRAVTREELRAQVAALAVQGAEQILKREVNAQVHADLLSKLATEL